MIEETQPAEFRPTSKRRLLVMLLVAGALVGLGHLVFKHWFAPPTATIFSSGYGMPAAAELALKPGAHLDFAVFAEQAQFSSGQRDSLLLRIELHKGKAVALVKECSGVGDSQVEPGGQTEVTFFGDECDLTVPDGGADLVQITPQWRDGGKGIKMSGLAFLIWVEDE